VKDVHLKKIILKTDTISIEYKHTQSSLSTKQIDKNNHKKAFIAALDAEQQCYRQARSQLGTPGWAKSFLRGAQIFEPMSINFELFPTHISRWC